MDITFDQNTRIYNIYKGLRVLSKYKKNEISICDIKITVFC